MPWGCGHSTASVPHVWHKDSSCAHLRLLFSTAILRIDQLSKFSLNALPPSVPGVLTNFQSVEDAKISQACRSTGAGGGAGLGKGALTLGLASCETGS